MPTEIPNLAPVSALLSALRNATKPIAFLVGSPLSMPDQSGGPGVPGVTAMLDLVRARVGADCVADLEKELSSAEPASRYQKAMSFLCDWIHQDAANQVIRQAVRQARLHASVETDREDKALEGDIAGWHLPAGTRDLGTLIMQVPEPFKGPILTTNFDPLLTVAVARAGGLPVRTSIDVDGKLRPTEVPDPRAREIVHLHGYWRDSDTLHTPEQLTAPRPRLSASLRDLLQEKTLLVVAYGGWDDVFTHALAEQACSSEGKLDVLWAFYESDPLAVANRYTRLLERTRDARIRKRFRLYGGVNGHEFFGKLLAAYAVPPSAGLAGPSRTMGFATGNPAREAALSRFKQCVRARADVLAQAFRRADVPLALSHVYVEVQLLAGARPMPAGMSADTPAGRAEAWRQRWMPVSGADDAARALPRDPFRLEEVMNRPGSRWVLLGEPGSGKTTLLHHLAMGLSDRPELVPLLLKVAELADAASLRDAVESVYGGGFGALLSEEVEAGRAVLLLDGLDEALERDVARMAVSRVAVEAGSCPVIVTSRPINYQRPSNSFTELSLLPLGEGEQRRLLRFWVSDGPRAERALERIHRSPHLRHLAQSPLLLTLVGLIMHDGQEVPKSRCVLYQRAIHMLLTRGFETTSRRRLREPNTALGALGWLALRLHGTEGPLYPTRSLLDALHANPHLSEQIRQVWGGLEAFLEEVAQTTGLLIPDMSSTLGATAYSFPHRTFREYLAARGLEHDIGRHGIDEVPSHLLREMALRDTEPPKDQAAGELGRVLLDARGRPVQWAEVLALTCGLLDRKQRDLLVRRIGAEGSAALLQRVVAEVDDLEPETVMHVLGMKRGEDDWVSRWTLLERLPAWVGDLGLIVKLAWQFIQTTRNGNDLWYARELLRGIGRGDVVGPVADGDPSLVRRDATELAGRVFDHLGSEARQHARAQVELLLQRIPAGSFLMGSPPDEEGRYEDEGAQQQVSITCCFQLMSVPVTQALYDLFDPAHREKRPRVVSEGPLEDHPVVDVTWLEASMFAEWVGGRLPDEAEWEYACRAGSTSRYWSGDAVTDLARVGWYGENSNGETHPVALKPANEWGLHDTLGNVFEWCRSTWKPCDVEFLLPLKNAAEWRGPTRVCRGGSWSVQARNARCANRYGEEPTAHMNDIGFRVLFDEES